MAEEFGEMLRVSVSLIPHIIVPLCRLKFMYLQETLEKMRERIEISSNNYEGPDLLIQQRMEELKVSDP